jgi:hypothetical protein
MNRQQNIAGTGRAPFAERGNDLYETPPEAVHALLRTEPLPKERVIWEPACGPGSIVRVLRGAGYRVYATDLVNYGCPDSESGVDFLMERLPRFPIGAVVSNAPFKLGGEFVAHALALGIPKVVMLFRLAFLESACRDSILDGGLLARVYPFSNRLPMMHRDGWEGPKARSAIAFAWFVWEPDMSAVHQSRQCSEEFTVKEVALRGIISSFDLDALDCSHGPERY